MNTDEAAAAILQGLGSQVWWDLDKTQVTPVRLREILAAEGVNISVPDIDPIQAVRRAARTFSQGRGNADRYKAEVTDVDGSDVYVGVLKHHRVDPKKVGWHQVELLCFDSKKGQWVKKDTYTDEGLSFTALADRYLKFHDHKWIRPNVIQAKLNECKAVALRRQGGIYFVPVAFMDELKTLKRVVASLGDSRLCMMHVMDDEDGREAVTAGVDDHVVSELSKVSDALTQWRESTRKIRSDSRTNVLGQLSDLLDIAEMYEGALGKELEQVKTKIDACRDDAMAILAGQELDAA